MIVRFTAALFDSPPVIPLPDTSVTQGSSASATLDNNRGVTIPPQFYVWVYGLDGTKVDVLD